MTLPKETPMIEKCAMALNDAWNFQDGPTVHLPPIEFSDAELIQLARAVLTALRDPTPEMIKAGMKCADVSLEAEYRAMIDAALNEGEG